MSFITINKAKQTAEVHGWAQPDAHVHQHHVKHLVLKVPGYNLWVGRFDGHGYQPAHFNVYEIEEVIEEDKDFIKIRATEIVNFPLNKPKEESE